MTGLSYLANLSSPLAKTTLPSRGWRRDRLHCEIIEGMRLAWLQIASISRLNVIFNSLPLLAHLRDRFQRHQAFTFELHGFLFRDRKRRCQHKRVLARTTRDDL